MAQSDILYQSGSFFLYKVSPKLPVAISIMNIKTLTNIAMILLLLYCFLVNSALNKNIAKIILSTKARIVNTSNIVFLINVFTSVKFIQSCENIATSAGVLAFITTKVKNAHKIINTKSNNPAKKPKILVIEIGSFFVLAFV
jgi:hypothetical protein